MIKMCFIYMKRQRPNYFETQWEGKAFDSIISSPLLWGAVFVLLLKEVSKWHLTPGNYTLWDIFYSSLFSNRRTLFVVFTREFVHWSRCGVFGNSRVAAIKFLSKYTTASLILYPRDDCNPVYCILRILFIEVRRLVTKENYTHRLTNNV